MSRVYPVVARHRSNKRDQPPPLVHIDTVGIFASAGYWHTSDSGHDILEFKVEDENVAREVAKAINLAYAAGRAAVQAEFRELLGIPEVEGDET